MSKVKEQKPIRGMIITNLEICNYCPYSSEVDGKTICWNDFYKDCKEVKEK